jgi:hypothetical protein
MHKVRFNVHKFSLIVKVRDPILRESKRTRNNYSEALKVHGKRIVA